MDGEDASPDTQKLHAIFQDVVEEDFDVQTAIGSDMQVIGVYDRDGTDPATLDQALRHAWVSVDDDNEAKAAHDIHDINDSEANVAHDDGDNKINQTDASTEADGSKITHRGDDEPQNNIEHRQFDGGLVEGVLDVLNRARTEVPLKTVDAEEAVNITTAIVNLPESQQHISKAERDELGRRRLLPIIASGLSTSVAPVSLQSLENSREREQPFVVPRIPTVIEVLQRQDWTFSAMTNDIAIGLSKSNKMNISSPFHGSSNSRGSTTQENEPEALYERHPELRINPAKCQSSGSPYFQDTTPRGESSKTTDTGHSYNVGEAGHITLDCNLLDPGRGNDDDDNNDENVDESQEVDLGPRHRSFFPDPKTPASKAIFDHPGTVMRPSQLFAATQPSTTGFRGLHEGNISSSRPSPDFHRHSTHFPSSPLLRRTGNHERIPSGIRDPISSSFHSPIDNEVDEGPSGMHVHDELSSPCHTSTKVIEERSPLKAAALLRSAPEPHERYISRRESQERRLRASTLYDDPISSDDEFSDGEAELNRIAKMRKEAAARELARASSSRPPGSAGSGIVEVPSTNSGRRRSVQEDYIAQCTGQDARDTQENLLESQPEVTIADSQSAPTVSKASSNGPSQIVSGPDQMLFIFHQSPNVQKDSVSSTKEDVDLPDQLPDLETASASNASATDGEDSSHNSPLKAPATQALIEVSGNRNELGTPLHKSLQLTRDELVPETSPPEAHQRRYVGFENGSQQLVSGDTEDEVCNPFTQDFNFNAVTKSPSPLPLTRRLTRRRGKGADETSLATKPLKCPTSSSTREKASNDSIPLMGEPSSEYVTAPDTFAISPVLPTQQPEAAHSNSKVKAIDFEESTEVIDDEVRDAELKQNNTSESARCKDGEHFEPNQGKASVAEPENGEAELLVTADGPSGQLYSLRSRDTLSRPSQLVRTSQKNPETRTGRTTSSRKALASKINVAKRSSLRASETVPETPIDKATLRRVTPSFTVKAAMNPSLGRASIDRNSSPDLRLLTRRASVDGLSTHSLRSSSRRTSIETLEQTANPEKFTTPVISRRRKIGTAHCSGFGLFRKMAFSVSYGSRGDEKQRVIRHIEQNGGRVLENGFDELFIENNAAVTSPFKATESGQTSTNSLTINEVARDTGFTCVIADKHSRRAKYIQALALGLPCISGKWIEHCVAQNAILEWAPYMLAAGESTFLGGAIRSRSLTPYSAVTANFANSIDSRLFLLAGKSILLVMGKKKQEEERKKAYLFLTQILGAQKVRRVVSNQEARKVLLEAERIGETWDWVYVDSNEEDADKVIFTAGPNRKRKRSSGIDDADEQAPKRVRLVSDEFVVQSLILGKLLDDG